MYTRDMSFGSLVRQYIEKNALSYQDLVEKLGYKSKTSVSRIIQDTTSYQLRVQFYKLFSEQYNLTDAETEAFESALNTSRLSDEHQALFSAYRHLFAVQESMSDEEPTFESAEGEKTRRLADLIRGYGEDAYNIDVVVFGLCSATILQTLYTVLDDMSCSFMIHHCLFSQADASTYIHLLSATADFLFDPRYVLYHCERDIIPMHVDNQIILHCDTENGGHFDSLLLQMGKNHLFCSKPITGELFSVYLRFFERNAACIKPLKIHKRYRTEKEQIDSFLSAQRQYAALESSHSIYCYRKSLGLEFIPPEIYKDAILLNRFPDKASLSMVTELVDAQRKRYQNLRTKKTPSYILLSQDALQNLIWTGRLRNHPFLLRPFSPRERAIVLKNLLSLIDSNPFFFLRFAAEDVPTLWNTVNITCYQQIQNTSSHKTIRDESLFFAPANEVSEEYSALQLTQPDIIASYAIFFREELWQKHTLSPKKSAHFIHLMLQYLASKGIKQ